MKDIVRFLYHNFYINILPDYPAELEIAVGDCNTLLDIGCGANSPIKRFSKKMFCAGVDAHMPSIEKSKSQGIHNEYYNFNVLDIGEEFSDNSYECVVASDLIEHLTKEDGYRLIEMMERIASKRVIIFTPNGFLKQGEYDENPFQVHLSGWHPEEMKAKGYKVIGINGSKDLRGEYAEFKYKPKYLWQIISDISQQFVRNEPERAFSILCTKEIK
jgi:ubiquinone/menaquinone biosynthesis C-methylase UbiE